MVQIFKLIKFVLYFCYRLVNILISGDKVQVYVYNMLVVFYGNTEKGGYLEFKCRLVFFFYQIKSSSKREGFLYFEKNKFRLCEIGIKNIMCVIII